jgi:hypothetical protein
MRADWPAKVWIDNQVSTAILAVAHLTNRKPLARCTTTQAALACREHILLSHVSFLSLFPSEMNGRHRQSFSSTARKVDVRTVRDKLSSAKKGEIGGENRRVEAD